MQPANIRKFPWRILTGFAAWAQDFSLMQKVLGGFLGVVVLVGFLTGLVGTRLAKETIIDRARTELQSNLATARLILKTSQEDLETKIRLMAAKETLKSLLQKGDINELRNRLTTLASENDLDFLSVTDDKGNILVRAFVPETAHDNISSNSLIAKSLSGENSAGIAILSAESLAAENPALLKLLSNQRTGMVVEAAYPMMIGTRVAGSIYGGTVLNNNRIVDKIAQQLFVGKMNPDPELDAQILSIAPDPRSSGIAADVGQVTLYNGYEAISTTLKGAEGRPMVGFQGGDQIRQKVLADGKTDIEWAVLFNSKYLSAAAPIRDVDGKVIGAIQVGTLERPISTVIEKLVITFMGVALVGVLLMAAISYFLVKWVSHPLEQMVYAAKRAAEGDLTSEVPVAAHDEVGELAATFNLMIRNLADSKGRLEEWGKDLASKVAEQTGELREAKEQMARVKKLASLEKMADGMAHIMAHISDPLVVLPASEETTGASSSLSTYSQSHLASSLLKVFVLDSEEKVLEICRRILQDEGFNVKSTSSVTEAMNELETEFFDVVIADIDMPEMRGKELLKAIKYRQPEVTVILTAPFKATEEAVEAVKLGAYDYIPKPFGPHQILLMVYTALQSREMLKKTKRQHAEQRAETIFQRLPVAIALADKEHRVVYHNRAFIELATQDGIEPDRVNGKTFEELFGNDPLDLNKGEEEGGGSRWLELEKLGRTAKLYNFKLPEEDLRVLMLLDVTETVMKDQQAHVFKEETINRAQQVIHQQMRVAQEIAGLLGETTAETKVALFELIRLKIQRMEN